MSNEEAIQQAREIIQYEIACLGANSTFETCGGKNKLPHRAQLAITRELQRMEKIAKALAHLAALVGNLPPAPEE